jgi:hypothetical protein
MARRDVQTGLALVAAVAIGFAIALLVTGGDNGNNANVVTQNGTTTTVTTTTTSANGTTTTVTTTGSVATPTTAAPPVASCIQLWNQATNRGAQTYLVNIAAQQPIRVHVGETSEVPPKCLVTVIANNGKAYVFPEGGGTTYPYAPGPSQTTGSALPAEQRKANALEQRDGTLTAS